MSLTAQVRLAPQSDRQWHRFGNTFTTGHAVVDGQLLEGPELARYLAAEFPDRLHRLWGCFAAAHHTDDGSVCAAVDRIRSIPLFYGWTDTGPIVSDDAGWLAQQLQSSLDDPLAAAAFLLSSTTLGPRTLSSSVFQIQAGEIVTFGREVSTKRYFTFTPAPSSTHDERALLCEGVEVFSSAFRRLVTSLAGLPAVLPLSGGMDSRLIASLLVKYGATNVRAFTYGSPRSFEARASKAVARHLGLEWECVSYSAREWSAWFASDSFQRFRRRAHGLTSIEHEQDWPAIEALTSSGWIPPTAVVVPGHAGDFIAGSHIPSDLATLSGDPYRGIYDRYFREWRGHGASRALQDDLLARIREASGALSGELAFTTFGWQERQAKMIANSVRVYEHFGLDWRLPFWSDPDLLEFWKRVPVHLRQGQRLYHWICEALMGSVLFELPSTRRPESRLLGKWRRLTDPGFGRYGIWLGARPLVAAARTRVGDLAHVDHPVVGPLVREIASPIARRPPQWVSLNGWLALTQLQDLARELR